MFSLENFIDLMKKYALTNILISKKHHWFNEKLRWFNERISFNSLKLYDSDYTVIVEKMNIDESFSNY